MGARHATQHPTPTSGPGYPRGPAPPRPRAQRYWWAHPTLSYSRQTCWTEGWSSTCCLWGAWGQPTVAGPRSHPRWSRYPLTLEQGLPRPCQSQREPWPGGCGWKRGPSGSKASPKVPSGAPSTACPHQRLAAEGPHQRRVPAIPPSACLPGGVPWGPSRLAPLTTQTTSQCRPGLSNRRGGEPWVRLGDRQGEWAADEAVHGCHGDSGVARSFRDRSWGCAGLAHVSGDDVWGSSASGQASGRVRPGSVGA